MNKTSTAAHDISDGGLLTTVCEMLFKYNLGLDINLPNNLINCDSYDPYFNHGVLERIKQE